MNRPVGLVVALPMEARAFLGRGFWKREDGNRYRVSDLKAGMPLITVLSGVGGENAMMAARWLISRDVRALISLGVAGGLDATLQAGDIVFGDLIRQEQGDGFAQIWQGRPETRSLIEKIFQKKEIRGCIGGIVSVKRPALTVEAKKKLYAETGAFAADMETGSAALVASESAIPFFAFRTVCDPANREVRESFVRCLDSGGQIRVRRILPTLLQHPSLAWDLLALKRDFQSALTGLHDTWHKVIQEMIPRLI